jgi:hypothetical protein
LSSQSQPKPLESQSQAEMPAHASALLSPTDSNRFNLTPAQRQELLEKRVLQIADLRMRDCPVSLRARQSAAGFMRQVTGTADPNGQQQRVGQRILLTVNSADKRRVAAASLTVHGFSSRGRVIEVLSTNDGSDAAKSFDVRFSEDSNRETSTGLWVPGFSAVRSVVLNSVTYSDGSTWMLSDGDSCETIVDGLMLISDR